MVYTLKRNKHKLFTPYLLVDLSVNFGVYGIFLAIQSRVDLPNKQPGVISDESHYNKTKECRRVHIYLHVYSGKHAVQD